jgi:chorismate synthase
LEKGIETITWTFDPLQAVNAHLNFEKLGVFADRYKVNYYGDTSSFLHRTGTDRLWVTWLLNSERVKRRLDHGSQGSARDHAPNRASVHVSGSLEPVTDETQVPGPALAIEIPLDLNSIARENVGLALRWREATRQAFIKALGAGYLVKEFYFAESSGRKIGVYLLSAENE